MTVSAPISAPIPANEAERLAALRRYAILDTEPEESFDRIVRLASRHFNVPIALVSLVDENRQWFKAACGLDTKESDRGPAFCAHAILSNAIMVVLDATKDERFARNPFVTGEFALRFYAGAPLVTADGHRLGTLCLIDRQPRLDFSEDDKVLLADLAAIVVDHIEMRYVAGDVLTEVEGRIEADARWRAAESRYRAIFNHTFQFCGLLDPDGTLLEVNDTAISFAGLTRADLVGKPVWDSHWWQVDDAAKSKLRTSIERAAAGEFIRYEIELQGAEGRRVPVDFSIKAVEDENGTVTQLIVEGRDISDKRESEALLRLVTDNLPFLVAYVDSGLRYRFINRTGAAWYARSAEEVVGRTTSDVLGQAGYPGLKTHLVGASKGQSQAFEERVTYPDGITRVIQGIYVPDRDDSGDVRGFIAIAIDITERKQSEDALRDNEERYRRLYNKTPIMLHSIDGESRLLSVSDFWLDKLGYARDDVIGRKSIEFLTPESRSKAVNDVIPEFLRTGLCTDIEYQMVSRSGEIIDVLLSAIAERDENGDVVNSLAVLTDITDRKEVERQFVQAQKMESVGQLTGGLAHDFNNLLGVVMGNLQLIERSVKDNEKAKRRIATALQAVDKGADLTRRLLAFARRQNLETKTVETGPLLAEMCHMLRLTLGGSVELECHVPDDIPGIRTDPNQLQSAILNLAVNARDAMPDGGKLTIEATTVDIDSDYAERDSEIAPGTYVVIAVTDTGEGISADKAGKVFEPFFTTKEVGKGSGLGLSTIYGFMRQSGGQIQISSEEGVGTTVRLYVPIATDIDVPATGAEGEDGAPISGGTEKVLIVEDQDEVREVGVALLEDLGYAVVEASSPAEGLRLLEADRSIDVLFTDIVMPGRMDGTKLALAARALRPGLPVVFTTGYAEAAVLDEGDVKSAKNLVTKPYRRDDLAHKLRLALDSAAAETAA